MINILALVGAGLCGLLILIWLTVWFVSLVRTEIGRGILLMCALFGIIIWGVLGVAYLALAGRS